MLICSLCMGYFLKSSKSVQVHFPVSDQSLCFWRSISTIWVSWCALVVVLDWLRRTTAWCEKHKDAHVQIHNLFFSITCSTISEIPTCVNIIYIYIYLIYMCHIWRWCFCHRKLQILLMEEIPRIFKTLFSNRGNYRPQLVMAGFQNHQQTWTIAVSLDYGDVPCHGEPQGITCFVAFLHSFTMRCLLQIARGLGNAIFKLSKYSDLRVYTTGIYIYI